MPLGIRDRVIKNEANPLFVAGMHFLQNVEVLSHLPEGEASNVG
jgi:hypothetical protein